MATQYNLFGGFPPYQGHSNTSLAAAREALPSVSALQGKILVYLSRSPYGATDEEIQTDLQMPANTQRPRRRELVLLGKVRDSAGRRRTESGRLAVVWIRA